MFVLDTVISWVCSIITNICTLQNAKADASLTTYMTKTHLNNAL